MKHSIVFSPFLIFFISSYVTSCKQEPFKPNFENGGGYVIGKERCNMDTTQDYWLVDFSIAPLPNNYGDSLLLNGIMYHHVVKTIGLALQFKYIGAKVDFDFHLSPLAVSSSNCNAPSSVTYSLKVMDVINQAEIH